MGWRLCVYSRACPQAFLRLVLSENMPTMTKSALITVVSCLTACSSGATTATTSSGGTGTTTATASSGSSNDSSSTAGSTTGVSTATNGTGATGTSTGTAGVSTGTGAGTAGSSTGSSTGGGIMVGTTCDPAATPDYVCAPAGYYCDPASSSCVLPPEFAPCNATVGCAMALTCISGLGDGGTSSLCAQTCTTGADCLDPLTTCGAVANTNGKACLLNTGCTSAYLSCNAAESDDGTCYPAMNGDTLYCQQGGPVSANEPCGVTRSDGGSTLCQVDSLCVNFSNDSSACLSICALETPTFPDGGPGCAAYSLCVGSSQGANWGICLLGCTTLADCPSPYTRCVAIEGPTGTFCVP
jgi:hypothetical protein